MPSNTNEFIFRLIGLYNKFFFTPSVILPKLPPGQTIRFGLISAALINGPAIISPSLHYPEVEIVAVAARQKEQAVAYAKANGIKVEKAYGGYQALLDDQDVDAVFIGLPNGLHAEWAVKALLAGKHVLCEKPCASNAVEIREIKSILHSLTSTSKVPPVYLEAYHYRFHPATIYVRNLLTSGTYGKTLSTYAFLGIPDGSLSLENIRFNYDLGGGALMDLGYTVSVTRYMVLGPGEGKPMQIVSATAKKLPSDDRIDVLMDAEMLFEVDDGNGGKHEVKSTICSDLAIPKLWGLIPVFWKQPLFIAETEKATITYNNFVSPYLSHSIQIKDKETGKCRTEKVFVFDKTKETSGLSTYAYQLGVFVKKVQGKDSEISQADWISVEDSIAQMETFDAIYEKAGMPIRNGSLYQEILKREEDAGAGVHEGSSV